MYWPRTRPTTRSTCTGSPCGVSQPVWGADRSIWMVAETTRRGREYLRLDCLADNPGICRYYEQAGFITVGETLHADGTRLRLCEMRVSG